jgi:hypothetical protein
MAGSVLKSMAVLRLNFCAKLNICALISATSPSCKTLCLIVESRRTFKHIWFLPTQKAQTKNQKSLNFANAQ